MQSQVSPCLPVPCAFPLAEEPDIWIHSDGRASKSTTRTSIHIGRPLSTIISNIKAPSPLPVVQPNTTLENLYGHRDRISSPRETWLAQHGGKAVSANISLSIGYGDHHENLKARNQPFLHGAILATVTWLFCFYGPTKGFLWLSLAWSIRSPFSARLEVSAIPNRRR